jgi:hypothetical protein
MSQEITSAAHTLYRDGLNATRICEELDKLYPDRDFAWHRTRGNLVEIFVNDPIRERVYSYVER